MIGLSFDVEEFDMPLENGIDISFDRQIEISTVGLDVVLNILNRQGIKATFFCTATYAITKPDIIKSIAKKGHEIASHSYYHSQFELEDLAKSKAVLEKICGCVVRGYRSPRMGEVKHEDLKSAGYEWDSSLNPCFLPGRYNNFNAPKKPYRQSCGLGELPASVSNILHFPLFWLALHNFPMWLYLKLCENSLKKQGFLNIYMHPWEFSPFLHEKELGIPMIVKRNSGATLSKRLERFIEVFKGKGEQFVTLSEIAHRML